MFSGHYNVNSMTFGSVQMCLIIFKINQMINVYIIQALNGIYYQLPHTFDNDDLLKIYINIDGIINLYDQSNTIAASNQC